MVDGPTMVLTIEDILVREFLSARAFGSFTGLLAFVKQAVRIETGLKPSKVTQFYPWLSSKRKSMVPS